MSVFLSKCAHCRQLKPAGGDSVAWQGRWYCSFVCSHDAGDRTNCGRRDCGCTGYARKRRLLREHRIAMRVMEEFLEEEGLDEELNDRMLFYTGDVSIFLGHCDIRDV